MDNREFGLRHRQDTRDIAAPPLRHGECHFWEAWIDNIRLIPENLLSDEEKARAANILEPRTRRQFCVTRALLRHLLAHYLRMTPKAVRLAANAFGKPLLPSPHADLYFNVSHSGARSVLAFSRQGPVGVDVEWRRDRHDVEELATLILHPREREIWQRLPPLRQATAFHDIWTRKEAFSKAVGEGLNLDFRQLDLGSHDLLSRKFWKGSRFHVRQIDLGPEYSAALAMRALDARFVHYRLDEGCNYLEVTK
jgi:4'-phosphopantetheinyl transferase